jgi:uncharacterized lipoprotein YddW (UPF0748 family)
MTRICLVFFLVLPLSNTTFSQSKYPKWEFRGVWIATVSNIDWPSKAGLSSADQQKEFIDILEMHKANGMNAVVVQVRPSADAFYPSRYEPWSKWLTGKLGQAPYPYYDPLKFMIEEAHQRGLEFHAWLNPYRGVINVDTALRDNVSVASQHPEWFVKYDKNLYFNPGLPEARRHTTSVVMDIVNRYNVDGVHFDDYFYPYRVAGLSFPDSVTFAEFGHEFASVEDWRRNNVDQLIKQIHDSIQQVKPFVKFGISPFGVWRNQDKDPRGSATQAGQTCYDDLYADVYKWMKEGLIDYVVPQIYWSIGFEKARYEILAKWWGDNSFGIPVIIGQAIYRIDTHSDPHWKENDQLPKQLRLNKSLNNLRGSIFFSSKSFVSNPLGFNDSLKTNFYKYPSLIYPSRTQSFNNQYPLDFTADPQSITLHWKETSSEDSLSSHVQYVIYRFDKNERIDLTRAEKIIGVVANTNPFSPSTQWYTDKTAKPKKKYVYIVTGLNRYHAESKAALAFPIKNNRKSWKTYLPIGL